MLRVFAPAIWLSARLSFSRKYALIGLLVLLALLVLGVPLLQRTHADKAWADTQRQGLQAYLAQARALRALVEARSQGQGQASDDFLATLNQAERWVAPASWPALQGRLVQGQAALLQTRSLEQRFAVLTGIVQAWLDLIRDSARRHRLNIDPELHATFDMLAITLPSVVDTLGRQRDAMTLHSRELTSLALGSQVVLASAVTGLQGGVAPLAADARADDNIPRLLAEFLQEINRQQEAVDSVLAHSAHTDQLGEITQANLQLANELLTAVALRVDERLLSRIVRLQRTQWAIVGLFVAVFLGLGYLFAGIYLSTMRSLRTLARGTAAFCEGKRDTRIRMQTRDELVEVARNFNSVADEVERLLGVVQQQNESRERELQTQVSLRTAELAEKNVQLQAMSERVFAEVNMAREMQLAILPQQFPQFDDWSLHATSHPAREMGGDFYDWVALRDGRYGLLVADVSGKGVAAAFFMAVSRTVLLDLASAGHGPAEVLRQANDLLCQRNPLQLFVTVCYGIFDPATGHWVYASAGHPAPMVRRQSGTVEFLPLHHDIALGVMPEAAYTEVHASIACPEVLLLYTDGVSESISPSGEEFGEARLANWLNTLPAQPVQAPSVVEQLLGVVDEFVAGAEPFDDLTCLVLCRNRGDTTLPKSPIPLQDKRLLLTQEIHSRLEEIPRLASAVDQALERWPDLAFQANLCMEELLTNIIQHGLSGAPHRSIHVRISMSTEWLEILIKDDAPPFDPFTQAPTPDLEQSLDDRPIGGLGIHMVKTMMDDVRAYYDGSGNLIVLLKTMPLNGNDQP